MTSSVTDGSIIEPIRIGKGQRRRFSLVDAISEFGGEEGE